MSHSHSGGNPWPHVITQGADWNEMILASYSPTNTIDTSGWTATYVVLVTLADGTDQVVLALGTSAGMVIEYNDGDDSTVTTGGITLGLNGDVVDTTTLDASAAEGASTVTLADASDAAVGQTIAIELDDGSIHLDTITDVVGSVVTLGGKLSDPATSGNDVTLYDADWAVTNVYLHLSKAATKGLSDWGIGRYRLDLIDPFGHVQLTLSGTCCLDRGYGHG